MCLLEFFRGVVCLFCLGVVCLFLVLFFNYKKILDFLLW